MSPDYFGVIAGGLADAGEHSAYVILKRELGCREVPFHRVAGNHANRQRFLEHFPDTPVDAVMR